MAAPNRPSLLIRLIALKKGIFALLLILLAIASRFSWRHYEQVTLWAHNYLLHAEYGLVRWGLQTLINSDIPTLQLISRAAGIYGLLLGVAAIGLWFDRLWAELLFITLVGVLIPVEIYELIQAASTSKVLVFMINLLIFIFLLVRQWQSLKTETLEKQN
uniref:DUF2127 domain-containing protein n=1 Tax=Cyanothece sp. (strain PCC 7425 / ATCC 29141) TaxID=395961 RepID=B8HY46_CYAP4